MSRSQPSFQEYGIYCNVFFSEFHVVLEFSSISPHLVRSYNISLFSLCFFLNLRWRVSLASPTNYGRHRTSYCRAHGELCGPRKETKHNETFRFVFLFFSPFWPPHWSSAILQAVARHARRRPLRVHEADGTPISCAVLWWQLCAEIPRFIVGLAAFVSPVNRRHRRARIFVFVLFFSETPKRRCFDFVGLFVGRSVGRSVGLFVWLFSSLVLGNSFCFSFSSRGWRPVDVSPIERPPNGANTNTFECFVRAAVTAVATSVPDPIKINAPLHQPTTDSGP